MVSVEPGTLGNVFTSTLLVGQSSSRLKTVVPILAALVADIPSPGTTSGAIELRDSDPSDAGCIVVVCNRDVACSATSNGLVYDLGADTA